MQYGQKIIKSLRKNQFNCLWLKIYYDSSFKSNSIVLITECAIMIFSSQNSVLIKKIHHRKVNIIDNIGFNATFSTICRNALFFHKNWWIIQKSNYPWLLDMIKREMITISMKNFIKATKRNFEKLLSVRKIQKNRKTSFQIQKMNQL